MQFQLFQYSLPAPDGASVLADLNAFLAAERVSSVWHHVVPTAGAPLLLFVVQTVSGRPPVLAPGGSKVDYKTLLTADQFTVYSRLRIERKKWAEAEGVPVYAVFTNAQLADFVQRAPRTPEELRNVAGMGQARMEKYGDRILEILAELRSVSGNTEGGS